MRRRIDRPTKRIVLIGAYLLLVPQIGVFVFGLFLTFSNILTPGKTYWMGELGVTPMSDGISAECLKIVILLALIWLYSAILWRVTGNAIRYRRQMDALRSNHCPQCGYDVRATPRRCPECGTQIRS